MVIHIVHKTREMHTPTNYLLANMAVSDVVSVMLLPLYDFIEYQLVSVSNNFEKFTCKQERIKGTEKASPIHTLFHR